MLRDTDGEGQTRPLLYHVLQVFIKDAGLGSATHAFEYLQYYKSKSTEQLPTRYFFYFCFFDQ